MTYDTQETDSSDTNVLDRFFGGIGRWMERHWILTVIIAWVALSAWLISDQWIRIRFLGLGDTDDNLRMAQVRALLDGQGWFDLRQHRMNWPDGLNVHWSRLVDLPIAGLILILKPFLGIFWAERAAAAIAPVLPLGILMTALSLTARRLIDNAAYPLSLGILATTGMALGMFQPLRIDHHGWQLTMVALLMVGLVDPKRLRGGMIAGAASAASLIIGMEMLPYLALAGAAFVLLWVWREEEKQALLGYAAALALGASIGFALFVSNDNRLPVCDAYSPVWFSCALLAAAALTIMALLRVRDWRERLAIAVGMCMILAAFYAGAWPQCLGRFENVPPELDQLWLSNVREAKPITAQFWKTQIATLTIPTLGLIGLSVQLWLERHNPERLARWASIALLPLAAFGMLFWQTRAGPAAQMLGITGAAALAWHFRGRLKVILVIIVLAGSLMQAVIDKVPDKPSSPADKKRGAANAQCPTITNMLTLNRLPAGKMLTFVDLGPRLIVTTHHDAVTGPYHRNARAILDIHHFFGGDEANAHEIVERRHIDYVMVCPDTNESTLYAARNAKGFYMILAGNKAPKWLERMEMPEGSPYMVWRVKR